MIQIFAVLLVLVSGLPAVDTTATCGSVTIDIDAHDVRWDDNRWVGATVSVDDRPGGAQYLLVNDSDGVVSVGVDVAWDTEPRDYFHASGPMTIDVGTFDLRQSMAGPYTPVRIGNAKSIATVTVVDSPFGVVSAIECSE